MLVCCWAQNMYMLIYHYSTFPAPNTPSTWLMWPLLTLAGVLLRMKAKPWPGVTPISGPPDKLAYGPPQPPARVWTLGLTAMQTPLLGQTLSCQARSWASRLACPSPCSRWDALGQFTPAPPWHSFHHLRQTVPGFLVGWNWKLAP